MSESESTIFFKLNRLPVSKISLLRPMPNFNANSRSSIEHTLLVISQEALFKATESIWIGSYWLDSASDKLIRS